MKNKILIISAFLSLSVLILSAQEKNKMQVKVIKSENGKTTTLDTILESKEQGDIYFYSNGKINKEKMDSILKSLDIDAEHGIKFISENLDELDSEKIKHIWISASGDEDLDLDKNVIIEMIKGDKIIESTDEFTITKDDSVKIRKIYIYHSGDENVYVTGKDGKKDLVSTSPRSSSYVCNVNDSEVKVITITDDLDVDDDEQGNVKVISTISSDDDNTSISKIIIKNGDGESKIIEVYMNEDEFDGEPGLIELEESGEKVKILKYKTDDGKIIVKAKIVDCEFNKEENETLEKIGLKSNNDLEIGKIKIYPNPTEGKFKLELEVKNKENLDIKIYNQSGTAVFTKKVKKFDGNFAAEIDISKEEAGTYFIQIIQADKSTTKKIVKK